MQSKENVKFQYFLSRFEFLVCNFLFYFEVLSSCVMFCFSCPCFVCFPALSCLPVSLSVRLICFALVFLCLPVPSAHRVFLIP